MNQTSLEQRYLGRPDPVIARMNRPGRIHWHVRVVGLGIFLILSLAAFIRWSERHTARLEAAYARYDQCVEETYGVSATKFFQVYGRAAHCD